MTKTAEYDLNLILDPGLSDAQVQTEKDAVDAQIQRAGGTLVKLDEWGSQRLAYPIRKLNEGYYLIYRLSLPNDTPKQIEASLRQRDNVMRVLVVKDRPEWHTRKAQPAAAPAAD
ncbi:MAG: 30S ribosomal protein S6 [Trueperaceae bacterium]|nr:30S ribosomal protein S6 [Trueperaceae bacterium]